MATMSKIEMLDVTCDFDKDLVEVKINWNRKVMWVNINGVCAFRMCRIPEGTAWIWNDESFTSAFKEKD